MARIDWPAFGEAVRAGFRQRGLSVRQAEARWPLLTTATISRSQRGEPVDTAIYVLLCEALELDPARFVIRVKQQRVTRRAILKRQQDQTVTVAVSRETQERPA